jgi:hypothetical protein
LPLGFNQDLDRKIRGRPPMPDREKPDWAVPDSDLDLDLLIRKAAASSGRPASDADLARRILSRVETENTAASAHRWLPWAAALPVAACLVFVFTLFAPRPAHTPVNQSETRNSAQPPDRAGSAAESKPFETAQVSSARSSRPSMVTRESLPKLETFPSPQALTPEEQALATYAAHASEGEQQALIEAREKLEAPLSIAAITIQPLEPPAPGGN